MQAAADSRPRGNNPASVHAATLVIEGSAAQSSLACAGVRPLRDMGDSSAGGARDSRWCAAATGGTAAIVALPGAARSAVSANRSISRC